MVLDRSFLSPLRSYFVLFFILLSAAGNAQIVELNFSGMLDRAAVFEIKKTLESQTGHIQSRIVRGRSQIWVRYQEGYALSENAWKDFLADRNLEMTCFLDHASLEMHPELKPQFQQCQAFHLPPKKTNSFNTCAAPLDVCDGDTINVTNWGPGTVITTWPDPPRNPEYDDFAIPPAQSPWTNPWLSGTNLGCLQSGELNTIWLRIVVTMPGQLEWAFLFPEEDSLFNLVFMDWALFPNSPTICADISNNNANAAPLRCNWNDFPESPDAATGMASNAAFMPIANEEDNFELSFPVVAGDEFLLLLDNFSAAEFPGIFDFSLSPNSAQVCGTVLTHGHTELNASSSKNGVNLSWINLDEQNFASYQMERAEENGLFSYWRTITDWEFQRDSQLFDANPIPGRSFYRIHKKDGNGRSSYSNVVSADWEFNGFEIVPNPTTEKVLDLIIYQPANLVNIYDPAGRLVFQQPIKGQIGPLELETVLSRGVYAVEVQYAEGGKLQKKLIVQ